MIYKTDKQYEILLNKLQNGADKQVRFLFNAVVEKLAIQLSLFPTTSQSTQEILHKEVVKIRRDFTNSYNSILQNYAEKAISLSKRKNTYQVEKYITGLKIPDKIINEWLRSNLKLNLVEISERVWKLTTNYFNQVEILTNAGLFSGLSAQDISKELKRFLNNPNSLDSKEVEKLLKEGKINKYQYNSLIKKVAEYKPGQGVYKSAFKNAFRLTRTEINMSYRRNDNEVRQKLPFVVGIEVKLSSAHPRFDICDDLAGKYPKDFNFIGWHPNCICYTKAILANKEDFASQLAAEDVNLKEVEKMPKKAKNYIKDKSENINKMKSEPFFIRENKKYYKDLL